MDQPKSPLLHILIYLILFFAIGLLYYPIAHFLHWPDADQIVALSAKYLSSYGYWIIFIASIMEATPLFNSYLPGSVVIVLTVASSRQSHLNPFWLVGLVDIGFFIGYIFDWLAGHYGWYKLFRYFGWGPALAQMEARLKRSGKKWLWATYFNPDVASLSTTATGILGYTLPELLSYIFLPVIAWNALWGVVAYYTGDMLLTAANIYTLTVCLVISILVYGIAVFFKARSRQVRNM